MAASPRASARRCSRMPSTTRTTGQLVSGSYMDYAMPRADDMPSFKLGYKVTPCPHNPLGVQGLRRGGRHRLAGRRHECRQQRACAVRRQACADARHAAQRVASDPGRQPQGSRVNREEPEMYDFAYHRPKSLADAVNGAEGQARRQGHGGRHDADPDPEAAPGQAERRGRPRRSQGPGRHQGRGRRASRSAP